MPKESPFPINDLYSLGYWLKDYGYYPQHWPLFTYMDHGMTFFESIPPHEKENTAPIIFKFSPRLVEAYRKVCKKPVYCLLNPTIHCRQAKKITQSIDARGTLFYPAHSTDLIDDTTNWDGFIANLEKIPAKYQPVDICLHPTDVKKGLGKVFESKGYKIYTAGNPHAIDFAENMYNILRNYKYTMSNLLGSYVFYSVEMNIPFSLYGKEPSYINKGDNNVEAGAYTSYKLQPTYQKAVRLFLGFHDQVTIDQLNFVNFELGKFDTISRSKACFLLYKAAVEYNVLMAFSRLKALIKIALRKIKNLLVWQYYKIKRAISFIPFFVGEKFGQSDPEEKGLVDKKYVPLFEIYKLKSGNLDSTILLGKKIQITDSFWYLHSLKEIFAEEVYRFNADTDAPYILDCGSNIGLSVIYFKRLFPKAEIVAFEPDKANYNMLQKNLEAFEYKDVAVQNTAIWKEDTVLSFSVIGSVGGRISDDQSDSNLNAQLISVPAVRLKNYLGRKVDFLKMDIEGPELEVLRDCGDQLRNVQHLFVEYHSDPAKQQELDELLSLLRHAGFRVYIKEAWNNLPYPFMRKQYQPFYDLQLNIFAYRV
jgi:FkbM family methyltransferase